MQESVQEKWNTKVVQRKWPPQVFSNISQQQMRQALKPAEAKRRNANLSGKLVPLAIIEAFHSVHVTAANSGCVSKHVQHPSSLGDQMHSIAKQLLGLLWGDIAIFKELSHARCTKRLWLARKHVKTHSCQVFFGCHQSKGSRVIVFDQEHCAMSKAHRHITSCWCTFAFRVVIDIKKQAPPNEPVSDSLHSDIQAWKRCAGPGGRTSRNSSSLENSKRYLTSSSLTWFVCFLALSIYSARTSLSGATQKTSPVIATARWNLSEKSFWMSWSESGPIHWTVLLHKPAPKRRIRLWGHPKSSGPTFTKTHSWVSLSSAWKISLNGYRGVHSTNATSSFPRDPRTCRSTTHTEWGISQSLDSPCWDPSAVQGKQETPAHVAIRGLEDKGSSAHSGKTLQCWEWVLHQQEASGGNSQSRWFQIQARILANAALRMSDDAVFAGVAAQIHSWASVGNLSKMFSKTQLSSFCPMASRTAKHNGSLSHIRECCTGKESKLQAWCWIKPRMPRRNASRGHSIPL